MLSENFIFWCSGRQTDIFKEKIAFLNLGLKLNTFYHKMQVVRIPYRSTQVTDLPNGMKIFYLFCQDYHVHLIFIGSVKRTKDPEHGHNCPPKLFAGVRIKSVEDMKNAYTRMRYK